VINADPLLLHLISDDIVLSTDTTLTNLGDSSNEDGSGSGGNLSSTNTNGSNQVQSVKSDGAIGDVWIRNYIRSENWKPSTQGFAIDGQTGYAEFHNVKVIGNITAVTGSIGGFFIGATDLISTLNGNTTKISSGPIAFSAGPTGAPTITITQAGAINASSGVIGGFTITSTELYGGIIKTSDTVSAGSNGVIMDTDGLRGYDAVLGLTFELPTDGGAPTFSSGIISETIYEINTNAVLRTSSTVGDGTAASAGILINDTGFYGCESNQLLADANVKILVDGTAEIKASIQGGQTDFNTGIGYFLGLSGGDYKFSIGDPSSNYMLWDGTYMRIKGSFDVGDGGLINNGVYTVATLPSVPTVVGFNPPSAYE
jgi:hypothetical protein